MILSRRVWGDREAFLGLSLLVCLLLGPPALAGRSFFWGDLTYLNHPWRVLPAQILQAGELPLWNRYAYLGMPLAAQMQCAVWYPLSVPFHLFPFPAALEIFHAAHLMLAGFFAYLWLRSWRLAGAASFGGAALLMLCGGMTSRLSLLNHLSTLAFAPAFLLFLRSPCLLALSLAAAMLGGYPPMLVGAAALCIPLWAAAELSRSGGRLQVGAVLRAWGLGCPAAAGLAACLLLPGLALALGSRRAGGMDLAETLTWSFSLADFRQLLAPWAVPPGQYSPAIFWWKTAYFGLFAWAAAIVGAAASPARAALCCLYFAGAGFLMLGGSTAVSSSLWAHLPPLRFIRYPGNTAYVLIPLLAWLAASGLHRRRGAWLGALLIAGELLFYAAGSEPTIARSFFADPGPLVGVLRSEAGSHRYLLSPRALQAQRGWGARPEEAILDLKHRLYGLTNMPYRLESAANFGEPLVPKPQYDFMDFVYRLSGLDQLAPWLPWADVRVALTRDRLPSRRLEYVRESLWRLYRSGEGERAYWLDEKAGEALPPGIPARAPERVRSPRPAALALSRLEEGAFRVDVRSESAGWLYIAEPLGAGWQARIGADAPRLLSALGPFVKLRVPAGSCSVDFRYRPDSWRWGSLLSLLSICALAAYWYNRWKLRFEDFHRNAAASPG